MKLTRTNRYNFASRLERLANLTLHASSDVMDRVRFVDDVRVCCSAEEYAQDEPGENGSIGVITIRAYSRKRYCAKRDELKADGWILLEG